MIRVYFVFEDPLDEEGVNLSYVDVPEQRPERAIKRVQKAARIGELWKALYPSDSNVDHEYRLIETKMMWLDISSLPAEHDPAALLGQTIQFGAGKV